MTYLQGISSLGLGVSPASVPALTNDKMTGEVIFCLQMHEKFMKKM